MLGAPSKAGTITILCAATVVAACEKRMIPSFEQVELHRSGHQSLVITNLANRTILLLPTTPGQKNIEIPSSGQWTIQFTVVTSVSRDHDGIDIAGSKHNDVEAVDRVRYLTLNGADWVLTAGPPEDSWEHRLFFGDCWFSGTAPPGSHNLEIASPPVSAVPIHICP